MAFDPITGADAPDVTRNKVNAGLGQASDAMSAVAGLQASLNATASSLSIAIAQGDTAVRQDLTANVASLNQALQQTTGALGNALTAEQQTRAANDTTERDARQQGDADLLARIARINAGLYPAFRPGETPTAFIPLPLPGDPDDLAPISQANYPLLTTGDGRGRILNNSRQIWTRALTPCQSGRLYVARWRYIRTANAQDPDGDAVQGVVGWFSAGGQPLGSTPITVVFTDTPLVSQGVKVVGALFGAPLGLANVITPPAGAVYYRLGFITYGNEAQTVILDLFSSDITDFRTLVVEINPPAVVSDVADLDSRVDVLEAASGSFIDQNFDFSVTDDAGNPLLGVTPQGRLVFEPDAPELGAAVDPNALFSVVDEAGYPLLQADPYSRMSFDGAPPPFIARQMFVAGQRRLAVRTSGMAVPVDISTGEFDDVAGFAIQGGYAYWDGQNADGTTGWREAFLRPKTALLPTVTDLVGLIIHGQSLAAGASSVTTINPVPLDPGRAAMFDGGVRSQGTTQADPQRIQDLGLIRNLVDLCERQDDYWGETVATQAANTFLASAPASMGMVAACCAVGGQPYEALKKGTVPFANLVTLALRMVQVARLTGRNMRQVCVFWRQGESNGADSEASYTAKLLELQADLTSIIRRLTGQVVDVILITDQISSFYNISDGGPPQALLTAALANPSRIASLGPKYWCTYSDGLHIVGRSQAWSGGYLGRYLAQMLYGGRSLQPLHAASAVRTGDTVAVTMAGGSGTNLVIDPLTVSNPGGNQPYGILWRDDGNGNAITVEDVTAAGQVLSVKLSGVPTGANGRIVIAGLGTTVGTAGGPLTGPRSCIRDSALDTVKVGSETLPMFNWASHQIIPVT
jgi:hypothetical protein